MKPNLLVVLGLASVLALASCVGPQNQTPEIYHISVLIDHGDAVVSIYSRSNLSDLESRLPIPESRWSAYGRKIAERQTVGSRTDFALVGDPAYGVTVQANNRWQFCERNLWPLLPNQTVTMEMVEKSGMHTGREILESLRAYGLALSEPEFTAEQQQLAEMQWPQRQSEIKRLKKVGREQAITAHPEWSDAIKAAIRDEQIIIGMDPAAVQLSWGYPSETSESGGVGGQTESWHYRDQDGRLSTLFFVEGRLVRWNLDR